MGKVEGSGSENVLEKDFGKTDVPSEHRLPTSIVARLQTDYQAALEYFKEALRLFQQLNHQWGIAHVLIAQGLVARIKSDYQQARTVLEQGLRLFRQLNDDAGIALALRGQVYLTVDEGGQHEMVMRLFTEALGVEEHLGNKRGVANLLYHLGIATDSSGDHAGGCAYTERSLALYNELGDQRLVGRALFNLAEIIAHGEQDYETASSLLARCIAINDELGDQVDRGFELNLLAQLAMAQGKVADAAGLYKESLRVFHGLGEKKNIIYQLQGLVTIARLGGNAYKAARLLGAADGLRQMIGLPLAPGDQSDVERDMTAVREQLGEVVFQQEYNQGLAMTLEEAVAFALA